MGARHAELVALAGALVIGCAAVRPDATRAGPIAPADTLLYFWAQPGLRLGRAPVDSLLNKEGSRRIETSAFYDRFWREHAKQLEQWSADPRINLNPNYIAALITKESGFDPKATSDVPANGIAQMTHIADLDLREIAAKAPAFKWMGPEVKRWPRHALVHREAARKNVTDSLLAKGGINARNEYLFDEKLAVRGALFWIRILATVWIDDQWPGEYGTVARNALNRGRSLNDYQLMQLVTVSYNQGYPYVAELVQKHGPEWTRHLNAESSDYLDRIEKYTLQFQKAAARRAGG